MRLAKTTVTLGTTALLAIAGTGTASAVTAPNLPAPGSRTAETEFWIDRGVHTTTLVSPYADGKPLRCVSRADHTSNCWQKRPDGSWIALAQLGPMDVWVYPVWEDPASVAGLVPALPQL